MKPSKVTLVLVGIVVILVFLLKGSIDRYTAEKREKERIYEAFKENNNEVLSYVKTLDDKLAVQSRVMELQTSELKELYPALSKEIQNLNIKINRVQSLSTTKFESEKQITTLIKDSTVHDTVKVRVFNYHDNYYTIKGIAIADTQKVKVQMRDTLVQVVYKGKRKHPYLWIFSKRQLEQRVSLKNPNAKIEYTKLIQIQK